MESTSAIYSVCFSDTRFEELHCIYHFSSYLLLNYFCVLHGRVPVCQIPLSFLNKRGKLIHVKASSHAIIGV